MSTDELAGSFVCTRLNGFLSGHGYEFLYLSIIFTEIRFSSRQAFLKELPSYELPEEVASRLREEVH